MNSSKDYGIFGNLEFTHIVIACNTFHLLEQEIAELVGQPILSLIDVVKDEIERRNIKKVALLASPTTISTMLYHNKLDGICSVEVLSNDEQDNTAKLIRLAIANKASEAQGDLQKQIAKFNQPVILGCTELSVIADLSAKRDLIDPIQLVVDRIFNN